MSRSACSDSPTSRRTGSCASALQDNALSALQKRATELKDIAQDTSVAALPRKRLQLALRLTDIRVVGVRPDGAVIDKAPAAAAGLPEPLTASDLHPERLAAGAQVSGRRGSTVYLAVPTETAGPRGGRLVVVATDTVDLSVLRKLFPLLLLAGLVVLGLAFAVAAWLARRLTRPISEIEPRGAQARDRRPVGAQRHRTVDRRRTCGSSAHTQ